MPASTSGSVRRRRWTTRRSPPTSQYSRRTKSHSTADSTWRTTRGMVACAVTRDADVGIDVEGTDRDVRAGDISARFFASSETAALARLAPELRTRRFFDLWTLKEALIKATGLGLAQSMDRFVFDVGAFIEGREIVVSGPPD